MDSTLLKTLNIIYTFDRSMPAHFTSDKGRSQTFMVDYDIPENDEYEMASESFNALAQILQSDLDLGKWYSAYVKVGEDIMIGSFILTKENKPDLINDLRTEIINNALEDFSEKVEGFTEIIKNPLVIKYLDHCAEFATQRAKGLPAEYIFKK